MSLHQKIISLIDQNMPLRRRPFACSFDLRLNVEKAFVVDANFFPAGWHRFHFPRKQDWQQSAREVKHFFEWTGDECIAIVPEHHVQNEDYLHNLVWLHDYFKSSGFKTFVMPITDDGSLPQKVVMEHIRGPANEEALTYHPFERKDSALLVEGCPVDFALSQYDGSRSELKLSKQVRLPFYPPHFCSWQHRRKHQFFETYHRFVEQAQKAIGEDLSAYTFAFDAFTVKKDLHLQITPIEKAALAVTEHWDKVVAWVKQVTATAINSDYWILKSDHGTYGLGVEVVHKDEPFEQWPVRKIKRFRHGRHNMPVLGLVLQEGIRSSLSVEGKVAERVDYYFLGQKFSHIFRLHGQKSDMENLNRPGSEFALDIPMSEDDRRRLDIASALAFGGVCIEFDEILQEEAKRTPERVHLP